MFRLTAFGGARESEIDEGFAKARVVNAGATIMVVSSPESRVTHVQLVRR